MRLLFFIILLFNTGGAVAQEMEGYCEKNLKGKMTDKKRKNICWCVEENIRSQLTATDRVWLLRRGRHAASVEPNEVGKKRIKSVEFQAFKNCSTNYKWKANSDDLGVPDDITTP